MKTSAFVLFLSVALSVYGVLNAYVFIRGLSALPSPAARAAFAAVFWALAAAFIAGRFLGRASDGPVAQALIWAGSFWIGALLYGFLIALVVDLVRLADALFRFLPDLPPGFRTRVFQASLAAVFLILLAGIAGACRLKVRRLDLAVPAGGGSLKELTVAVASDIHLGALVGKRRLGRIAGRIQSLKPDLILLPGDIVDEDVRPAIRKNLGEALRDLSAPLGVFACTGNHEYFGGIGATSRYLESRGITLLRDSAVLLDNGPAVAGREDVSLERFTGRARRPLKDIVGAVPPGRPVILMDHQPSGLSEAAENGVSVLLCGHTHAGQFWPVNLIVKAIFEIAFGYRKKGDMHVVVSSGAGTWGPPIRILAPPEIVLIRIRFE